MWLQGSLCYTSVIFMVTWKVLAESSTINWIIIFLDFGSIGFYFLCFWLESQIEFVQSYGYFEQSLQFYIHGATVFFLTFFMYVINKFIFEMDRVSRENKEVIELEKEAELLEIR